MNPDWNTVTEFENRIAEFFGAPYAVAVDSCTHGLELCLRYKKEQVVRCPVRTYLSVPMLANKLGLELMWREQDWKDYYFISANIIDAAVYWKRNGYNLPGWSGSFMCLSFQYQKHLSLGRGGMILCPDEQSAEILRKMTYDGRERGTPWREQDIDTMGYHYYMTPETANLGLTVLDEAIRREPRIWSHEDYPDLTQMKIFKNGK